MAADRDRLFEILVATVMFSDDELAAAIRQVDEAVGRGSQSGYYVFVAEWLEEGRPIVTGYACYGPTPKAEDVYDLYWIAVDPKFQGQGIGRQLLRFVENDVRNRKGRMLLIETSSKESYRRTLRFYEQCGYDEISRIKDFYRLQHDKVIFCKRVH